jgi:hypothetical protein
MFKHIDGFIGSDSGFVISVIIKSIFNLIYKILLNTFLLYFLTKSIGEAISAKTYFLEKSSTKTRSQKLRSIY